jgi:hypothetical protein
MNIGEPLRTVIVEPLELPLNEIREERFKMAQKERECCENCIFWRMLEGQTARPFWGLCIATHGPTHGPLGHYIRPVPERLETVGPFYCAAYQWNPGPVSVTKQGSAFQNPRGIWPAKLLSSNDH